MSCNNCFNNSCHNRHHCRNHCCNPCETRFLTPNEILKEAVFNPCLLFCGTVIPTGTVAPTPLPPLPAPVPPVPPGRVVIGEGIFEGIPSTTPQTFFAVEFNGTTQGTGISHVNGDLRFDLIPNTMYEYSYTVTLTPANMIIPNTVSSYLQLSAEDDVQIGLVTRTDVNGTITLTNSGIFTTNNIEEQMMYVVYRTTGGLEVLVDSASLMIQAVQ